MSFIRILSVGSVVVIGGLTTACGDLADPILLAANVEYQGDVVQTLDIDLTGSNVFNDDVHPDSTFVLEWDEPVQLDTAIASIELQDASDTDVPITLGQRLSDVTISPDRALDTLQNHTILIDRGIDDESNNTTDFFVNITFYVDTL